MHPRKKNSHKISNEFWQKIEPLLPERKRPAKRHYQRRPGAGRKSIPARQAFEAILYVLRSGTPWKELPKTYGSASAVHRRFRAWHDAGLFTKIWLAGLAEEDEMEGVSWTWHRADHVIYRTFPELDLPHLHAPGRHGEPPPFFRRAWHPAIALRNRPKHSQRHVFSSLI